MATSETAMDGMPNMSPSMAAATVPLYNMELPVFCPRFMPEITRCGGSFISFVMANLTQSAGVPASP